MARLTVQNAIDDILDRIGVGSAGQASPEVVALITRNIASTQRDFALRLPYLIANRRQMTVAEAGRRWFPLPGDQLGVQRVVWIDANGKENVLTFGILAEDLRGYSGAPSQFDFLPTYGVTAITASGGTGYTTGVPLTISAPGGTGATAAGTVVATSGAATAAIITDPGADYVLAPTVTAPPGTGATFVATIGEMQAVRLERVPDQPGTLVVEWRDLPTMAPLQTTDRLKMDELAVILTVAAICAPAVKSTQTQQIAAQAAAYMDGLESSRPATGGFSLSPLRQRG